MNQQSVYAVIGCIDYEGAYFPSLRLFDCKSTADVYAEELRQEFDSVEIEERQINFQSMIGATC